MARSFVTRFQRDGLRELKGRICAKRRVCFRLTARRELKLVVRVVNLDYGLTQQ